MFERVPAGLYYECLPEINQQVCRYTGMPSSIELTACVDGELDRTTIVVGKQDRDRLQQSIAVKWQPGGMCASVGIFRPEGVEIVEVSPDRDELLMLRIRGGHKASTASLAGSPRL